MKTLKHKYQKPETLVSRMLDEPIMGSNTNVETGGTSDNDPEHQGPGGGGGTTCSPTDEGGDEFAKKGHGVWSTWD